MQTQQMVKELLSSSPVRTLQNTANRTGRTLNRTGYRLNRQLRNKPLAVLATLLASNVGTMLLARRRAVVQPSRFASRAAAIAAVAGGALAVGVMSIGALAIARVAVRSMRIKRLQIDTLEVRQTFGTQLASGPATTPA